MADEISLSVTFSASKDGAALPTAALTSTLDMTGADVAVASQDVGTSWELLDLPADLTGDRRICIKSLEAEGGNYVDLAVDVSGTKHIFSKLHAADINLISPTGDVYARANTAAVRVYWKAAEV